MRTDFVVLVTFLVLAIGSMPIYALTGKHRQHDPLESSKRGDFVLGPFVRSWFYWFTHPIIAVSLALRLSPLFYNLLGVAFGIAGGVAFATGHMALGGWGVLLGGAMDAFDAALKRAAEPHKPSPADTSTQPLAEDSDDDGYGDDDFED